MGTERQSPDVKLASGNLTGVINTIQDDPDAPDGQWMVATGNNVNTQVRTSFPTPTGNPTVGADLQEFKVWVRQFDETQTGTPNCRLELFENGGLIRAGSDTPVPDGGLLLSFTWNANEIATADGSLVECNVFGTAVGGAPGARNTVEVGALEWNVTYSVGGTTHLGAATLSGIGALAGIGTYLLNGLATLSGVGSLTASAVVVIVHYGVVTLSGAGALITSAVTTLAGKATLDGVGTLTGIGRGIFIGASTLAGAGSLVAKGVRVFIGKATLAGVGALSAIGEIAVEAILGVVTFSGMGALVAKAKMTYGRILKIITSLTISEDMNITSSITGGVEITNDIKRDLTITSEVVEK